MQVSSQNHKKQEKPGLLYSSKAPTLRVMVPDESDIAKYQTNS